MSVKSAIQRVLPSSKSSSPSTKSAETSAPWRFASLFLGLKDHSSSQFGQHRAGLAKQYDTDNNDKYQSLPIVRLIHRINAGDAEYVTKRLTKFAQTQAPVKFTVGKPFIHPDPEKDAHLHAEKLRRVKYSLSSPEAEDLRKEVNVTLSGTQIWRASREGLKFTHINGRGENRRIQRELTIDAIKGTTRASALEALAKLQGIDTEKEFGTVTADKFVLIKYSPFGDKERGVDGVNPDPLEIIEIPFKGEA